MTIKRPVRLTEARLAALRLVEEGTIRQRVASGCTWEDELGFGPTRDIGKTLTDLRRMGLIEVYGPEPVRNVQLTEAGQVALTREQG